MTGMSLYSLAESYRELQHIGTDGELDQTALEAISNTLEGLQGDIQVKAVNVGAYLLNLEAYSDAAIEASKALKARADRIQRRADVMREYLRAQMQACEMRKIDGPQFSLIRKTNPPAVIISPEAELPDHLLQPPDSLIERVVSDVQALQAPDECRSTLATMMVTADQLRDILTCILPQRAPDKKKIGDILKAATKAHESLTAVAQKTQQPAPVFISPIPGCMLIQGERLEVKP